MSEKEETENSNSLDENVDKETKKLTSNAKNEKLHRSKLLRQPLPSVRKLRLWTKCVMIVGSTVVAYVLAYRQPEIFLAKQGDILENTKQHVVCSDLYRKEVINYPACVPDKCGRTIMDRLITLEETEHLLDMAKRYLSFGGSNGGASIVDLHSGSLSLGDGFINMYKQDISGLFFPEDFEIYKKVREKVKDALARSFRIGSSAVFLTHPTFFSRLTATPPVTPHDEYWHPHVDKETYKSFHYTTLLYLNNYRKDFRGGRFIYHHDDNSTLFVEPRKSRLSMFTSGWENKHSVEKVTSGERYALTISFTCDPKYAISDPSPPFQNEISKKTTNKVL